MVAWDWGDITVQTEPGATCNAKVLLPDGQYAGGLRNPKVADATGTIAWTYPQVPTQSGTGTAIVSCTRRGLSGTTWSYFPVNT